MAYLIGIRSIRFVFVKSTPKWWLIYRWWLVRLWATAPFYITRIVEKNLQLHNFWLIWARFQSFTDAGFQVVQSRSLRKQDLSRHSTGKCPSNLMFFWPIDITRMWDLFALVTSDVTEQLLAAIQCLEVNWMSYRCVSNVRKFHTGRL